MEIDRKALKQQAREAMGLPRPRFQAVTLVYLLMTSGVSILCSLIPLPAGSDALPGTAAIFFSLFLFLYGTVVSFGYTLWALWASRRLNPGLGSLTQGFSVAGRVILMRLLILLRQVGANALAVFVMLPLLFSALIPLVFLALLGIYIAVSLRYALAPYLLADHPDDGAGAAVRRSAELMRGWKWTLFRLELSFLGWVALRWLLTGGALGFSLWYSGLFQVIHTLTFSDLAAWVALVANSLIAFSLSTLLTLPLELWLTPYQEVTRAGFYDLRLRAQQASVSPLPPL